MRTRFIQLRCVLRSLPPPVRSWSVAIVRSCTRNT